MPQLEALFGSNSFNSQIPGGGQNYKPGGVDPSRMAQTQSQPQQQYDVYGQPITQALDLTNERAQTELAIGNNNPLPPPQTNNAPAYPQYQQYNPGSLDFNPNGNIDYTYHNDNANMQVPQNNNGNPQGDANFQNFISHNNDLLGLLGQQSQLHTDPRINDYLNQQVNQIGNNSGAQQNLANQNAANQGDIVSQLQKLLGSSQQGQSQFANNNQNANNQLMQLFGQGQNFINGQQNFGGFDPYNQSLQNSLNTSQGLDQQIQDQSQGLITANNEQSNFEEKQAMQSLNDELSARGLSNSSAGVEAISSAQAKFARQRAIDSANIRQQAQQQAMQQRQQNLQLGGQLASQGGQPQGQVGQLQNYDLNSRLRGLEASGGIANNLGTNNLNFNAQQGRGNNDMLNILGQLGGAQNNAYGAGQNALNSGNNSLQQIMQLLSGGENRNLNLQQNQFANTGNLSDKYFQNIALGMGDATAGGQNAARINADAFNTYQQGANNAGAAAGGLLSGGLNYANTVYPQTPQTPQTPGIDSSGDSFRNVNQLITPLGGTKPKQY